MKILRLILFSLIYLPYLTKAQSTDKVTALLAKQYIFVDGVRHSTQHKLTIKSNYSYILQEKNFKGKLLIQGAWAVRGDTLLLSYTTFDSTKIKKYFIVKEGLKSDKNAADLDFYTKEEWKKKVKLSQTSN